MNERVLFKPFLYSQLMLSLVVVLLCTLLSSTTSHQLLRENMAGLVIENNDKILGAYTDSLNRLVFSSAQDLYLRVFLGPATQAAGTAPDFLSFFSNFPLKEHLTETIPVRNYLQNLCLSNPNLSRIEIFYPDNKLLISNNEVYYDLFYADRIQKMSAHIDWYQRFQNEGVRDGFYSTANQNAIIMIRPLMRGNTIQSILFIYYDKAALRRTLETLLPVEIDGILLLNESGVPVFSLGGEESVFTLDELPENALAGGSFETGAGQDMRLHSVRRDGVSGWYYIVSAQLNPYVQASNYITNNLLISGAITLAVGILLIFLLNSHNARPMKALLRLCVRSELTPVNERDAYRFVSGTLSNVMDGLDAAQRENLQISHLLRNNFAQWLLAELPADPERLDEAARRIDSHFPHRYFCAVAAVCGPAADETADTADANAGYCMAKLFVTFEEAFRPGGAAMLGGFGYNERTLLCLFNFEHPADFEAACARLTPPRAEPRPFYFSTGGLCGGLREAAAAADGTVRALDARYLFPERTRLPCGGEEAAAIDPEALREAQRTLLCALKKKNAAQAEAALDIWVQCLRAQGRADAALACVRELWAQLEHVPEYDGAQIAALRDIFVGHDDLPALRELLAAFLRGVAAEEEERRASSAARLIEGSKECIAANLTNPQFSLSFAANALGVSPAHLSRVFPRHCGLTFTEYVLAEKLENARWQLLHSRSTIQEISESLGYSSTQHFIALYKKRYGMTPSAFRREEQTAAILLVPGEKSAPPDHYDKNAAYSGRTLMQISKN